MWKVIIFVNHFNRTQTGPFKSNCSLFYFAPFSGESKVYRPRRPRSSSDALSASFNGELLDSRQHCNSYDNLDATEDSDGDDGPICVPALISPPRSAGEDVDLSPPDIGMASLDFDPMSFQCSLPDTAYAFPLNDSPAGAEGSTIKRSPSSMCGKTNGSDLISASFLGSLTSHLSDFSLAAGENTESKKLTTSYSYTDKPTQAVSPIKCGKTTSLTPFATSELFSTETSDKNTAGQAVPPQPLSPPLIPKDSPPLMGSVLLRVAEPSLSEAFQMELHSKLAVFDSVDSRELKGEDGVQQVPAASSQEHQGKGQRVTSFKLQLFLLFLAMFINDEIVDSLSNKCLCFLSLTFAHFPTLKPPKNMPACCHFFTSPTAPFLFHSLRIDSLCFCVPARIHRSGLFKGPCPSFPQMYSSRCRPSSSPT